MLAAKWVRKHVRQEQALINLNAVLIALRVSGLGVDLLSSRDQSRNEFRRGVNEVVKAAENRATPGQQPVDLLGVGGEKKFTRCARNRQQRVRSRPFGLVSPGLARQRLKEARRLAPKRAIALSIGVIVAGFRWDGARPFFDRLLGQARSAQQR